MIGTLFGLCAASYAALGTFVLLRTQPNPSRVPLLVGSLLTLAWATTGVAMPPPAPLDGMAGIADLLRLGGWYGVTLHLYRRFMPGNAGPGRTFVFMGMSVAVMAGGAMLLGTRTGGLVSAGITARLVLAICQLLLLENLLRNAPDEAGWNINLICIALGALGVYDIVLCTDAALFRQVSPVLAGGRVLAAMLVVPLLALAARRVQRWTAMPLALSRAAAFHSASLVASGVLLLGLAGVGEVFRAFGTGWGAIAEIGLLCGGVIAVAVLLSSGSGRSRIRAALVDPFFTERYDYRREWLRCTDTLAGTGSGAPLHARVIRTVAQVVDSPGGVLFLREPASGGNDTFQWAGSWNMPAVALRLPFWSLAYTLCGPWEVPAEFSTPDSTRLRPTGRTSLCGAVRRVEAGRRLPPPPGGEAQTGKLPAGAGRVRPRLLRHATVDSRALARITEAGIPGAFAWEQVLRKDRPACRKLPRPSPVTTWRSPIHT